MTTTHIGLNELRLAVLMAIVAISSARERLRDRVRTRLIVALSYRTGRNLLSAKLSYDASVAISFAIDCRMYLHFSTSDDVTIESNNL